MAVVLARCSAPERVRSIADSGAVGGTHSTGCGAPFSMFSGRGRWPPCLLLLHAPGTAPRGQPGSRTSMVRRCDQEEIRWIALN